MSDTAIKVSGLSKKYIISHETSERYTALRDVIQRKTNKLFSRKKNKQSIKEEFWALKDINFEVKQGDALGIIGRNGAGKSTLLKILSRITEPTKGRVEIHKRVSSLLEVGTGFHPELTGRENVFLNGAILGMSRTEIKNKFDEIVDFSGVEKFLDTPVKRYSTGMQLRLAFAVAAHLEPEILIVDEVLAVGDAEFQKKCLGKIDEVSKKEGRTVLFVSHNLAAIQQLCSQCMWLENGMVRQISVTKEVVGSYLSIDKNTTGLEPHPEKDIFISDFDIYAKEKNLIVPGSFCVFKISVTSKRDYDNLYFGVGINDKMGNRVFTPFSRYDCSGLSISKGIHHVYCEIESLPLKPDIYDIHIYVGSEFEAYDYIDTGVTLAVNPYPFFKYQMPDVSHGPLVVKQKWYHQ